MRCQRRLSSHGLSKYTQLATASKFLFAASVKYVGCLYCNRAVPSKSDTQLMKTVWGQQTGCEINLKISGLTAVVDGFDIDSRMTIDPPKLTSSLVNIFSRLPPLLIILETGNDPSSRNLDVNCRYPDFVAAELRKRAVSDTYVLVFDVPDGLPLKAVKRRILNAYNVLLSLFMYQAAEKLQPSDCPCFSNFLMSW